MCEWQTTKSGCKLKWRNWIKQVNDDEERRRRREREREREGLNVKREQRLMDKRWW
jgi:hypothetical protein